MKIRDLFNFVRLSLFTTLAVVSLILHALTFIGYDPRVMSTYLWYGLQFGSAFAFLLAFIIIGRKGEGGPFAPHGSLDKLLSLCVFVFIIYGLFNWIFTDMVLLHTASPEIVNGQYVIGSHGSFRSISKGEFMKARVYEARMNSGHWVACFLLAIMATRWKEGKDD